MTFTRKQFFGLIAGALGFRLSPKKFNPDHWINLPFRHIDANVDMDASGAISQHWMDNLRPGDRFSLNVRYLVNPERS